MHAPHQRRCERELTPRNRVVGDALTRRQAGIRRPSAARAEDSPSDQEDQYTADDQRDVQAGVRGARPGSAGWKP